MNILGLNLGYMATASLCIDGKIVSCVSQERFSRNKNDESYPKDAIEFCLKNSKLKASDIDIVAIGSTMHDVWHRLGHYYSKFSIQDRLDEQYKFWKPLLIDKKKILWQKLYYKRLDFHQYPGNWKTLYQKLYNKASFSKEDNKVIQNFLVDTIHNHLKVEKEKVRFVDHHTAHACYAYYSSPYTKGRTLVLTLDAFGDGASATVSIGENKNIKRVKTISHKNFQIARIYRYITLLLGMKPDEHEYKVMGLAPYAKQEIFDKAYKVFKETMYVEGIDFKFKKRPKDLYHHFKNKLEGIRFDGIAGGLQLFVEELICQWVQNVVKKYKIEKLVFAGGVVMNIKAIQKVSELESVEQIFVPPSPGDDSLGMGAAYYYAKAIGEKRIYPLKNAYLGSGIDNDEILKVMFKLKNNPKFRIIKNIKIKDIAVKLSKGRILARCAGRMEFGARSLGNRSILADPRSSKMIRVINEKIKNRDFWMPFAPAILKEKANIYIKNPKRIKAPFMTIAFDTTSVAEDKLAAAIHPVDFTARPQLVDKNENLDFHSLISEFYKITGVAGLLNTSFNLHGKPIVRTADEALEVFEMTEIDDLWLGSILISKK